MRPAALAILFVLSGCLGATPAPAPDRVCPGPLCDPPAGAEARPAGFQLDAPVLPAGRAWTYHVDGVYNTGRDMTVVVVPREGGYLFAGAAESDLWEAAIWGAPWQGPVDAQLNPEGAARYAWPLVDGKTWTYAKDATMTAHETDVRLPNGTVERGFLVEGKAGEGFRRFTYAPSVGSFTEFASGTKDVVYEHAVLTRVGGGAKAVWFEEGPRADASGGAPPSALQVPAGFDAVLASAGGTTGRAAVVPPGDAPWTWDAAAKEQWSYQSWPATAGAWGLAAAAPPQSGFTYVTAVAVKWTQP